MQGVPVLKCPGCGTRVADGTAICPKCDYIIDNSFISTSSPRKPAVPDEDHEEATSAFPAAGAPQAPGRPPPARPAPAGYTTSSGVVRVPTASGARPKSATGSRPAVPTPQGTPQVRAASRSTPVAKSATGSRPAVPARRDAELDPADVNYVPPRQPASNPHSTGQIVAPEELAADFKDFLGELGSSDKIVFFSAIAVILSAFTPWKETAEDGDILGLMSLGLLAILGAIGILGTLAVRVRRIMPALNELVPWMVQLGLSVGCVLWCLIFMKLSWDSTEVPSSVGNEIIRTSTPSFGAVLGLFGALGCLGGTLLGLRERPEP